MLKLYLLAESNNITCLYVEDLGVLHSDLAIIETHCSRLEEIEICDHVNLAKFPNICNVYLNSPSQIQYVEANISAISMYYNIDLTPNLTVFTKLKSLNCSCKHYASIKFIKHSQLEILTMRSTDEDSEMLKNVLPTTLTDLYLTGVFKTNILTIVSNCCPKIENIKIKSKLVSTLICRIIPPLSRVRDLNLCGFLLNNNDLIMLSIFCPKITYLNISKCTGYNQEFTLYYAFFAAWHPKRKICIRATDHWLRKTVAQNNLLIHYS